MNHKRMGGGVYEKFVLLDLLYLSKIGGGGALKE